MDKGSIVEKCLRDGVVRVKYQGVASFLSVTGRTLLILKSLPFHYVSLKLSVTFQDI
jgi:hypothetical protein